MPVRRPRLWRASVLEVSHEVLEVHDEAFRGLGSRRRKSDKATRRRVKQAVLDLETLESSSVRENCGLQRT